MRRKSSSAFFVVQRANDFIFLFYIHSLLFISLGIGIDGKPFRWCFSPIFWALLKTGFVITNCDLQHWEYASLNPTENTACVCSVDGRQALCISPATADDMGCGASKGGDVRGDSTNTDQSEICSVTQIRDIAPQEVADTGAHPPRRNVPICRKVCTVTILTLPGVVPEPTSEADGDKRSTSSARLGGESLIKMHPPKRPQRLDDSDIFKIKSIQPEEIE
ncbi:hypothetical protein JTE90_019332 [Oedothorax gibbosus]|uniref:Uncharacterized protein n=1 Tax=Oedothorax gibbosus TaxID=931172 RepID=A0AAV6UKA8_9ARAC|nr:hypothetical protein JTE90_019332 [Oedothorax gibbosus]